MQQRSLHQLQDYEAALRKDRASSERRSERPSAGVSTLLSAASTVWQGRSTDPTPADGADAAPPARPVTAPSY